MAFSCPPSLDLLVERLDSPHPIFRAPLLKCPEEEGEEVGFASGTRSALFQKGETVYRLKGCGNNIEGFLVRGCGEVRGAASQQTSLRELFACSELSRALGRDVVANSPEAVFEYSPLRPGGPVPACAVSRTVGDRRLGTHLLQGLALLFRLLVDDDDDIVDDIGESQLFPDLEEVVTAHFLHATADFEMLEPPPILEHPSLLEKSPESATVPRRRTLISLMREPSLEDVLRQEAFQQRFERLPLRLHVHALLTKIGSDAGRLLRKIHDAGWSWGTYQDSLVRKDLGEFHCNSHPNNFVVLPPDLSCSSQSLLGVLDFDLAFRASEFVDFGTGRVGLDSEAVLRLYERERWSLLMDLAGSGSAALSSGLGGGSSLASFPKNWTNAMVVGFERAYVAGNHVHFDELQDEFRLLIELGLLISSDKKS